MSKLTMKEIVTAFRTASNEELLNQLNELKQEFMKIRFVVKTDPNKRQLAFKVKNIKKSVARIKTILRERELLKVTA